MSRRGGRVNGLVLDEWQWQLRDPPDSLFELERGQGQEVYRDEREPEMPDVDVEWTEVDKDAWDVVMPQEERWTVRQGTGADCSVAAGLGVSIEHNRLWGTSVSHSRQAAIVSLMITRFGADWTSLEQARSILEPH